MQNTFRLFLKHFSPIIRVVFKYFQGEMQLLTLNADSFFRWQSIFFRSFTGYIRYVFLLKIVKLLS